MIISELFRENKGESGKRYGRTVQKSCIGMFYNMIGLVFQGQLYLHLVFKQDSTLSMEKLIFHFNNCVMEFGSNEFTLISSPQFGYKSVILVRLKFYK